MLFTNFVLSLRSPPNGPGGLANGSVTVAFRWWRRPTVKTGGTLRTAAGVLAGSGLAAALTESLEIGYRLSPRGAALLSRLS
jgi:hypothetical protein